MGEWPSSLSWYPPSPPLALAIVRNVIGTCSQRLTRRMNNPIHIQITQSYAGLERTRTTHVKNEFTYLVNTHWGKYTSVTHSSPVKIGANLKSHYLHPVLSLLTLYASCRQAARRLSNHPLIMHNNTADVSSRASYCLFRMNFPKESFKRFSKYRANLPLSHLLRAYFTILNSHKKFFSIIRPSDIFLNYLFLG